LLKSIQNLSRQGLDICLPVNNEFHQIGRVIAIVKIEEHLPQVGVRQRITVSSRKLVIRMAWLGQMFAQLIFSPQIILQIF
jgi:hypothetical protein